MAGRARLLIQVTAPRYTVQKVIDGLNTGDLKYSSGAIFQGNLAVARYHIREIDDRLENFRIDG